MSRIGRMPITVPAGVSIDVAADNTITVKSGKNTLSHRIHPLITVEIDGSVINVKRGDDEKMSRSLHGMSRTMVSNMVTGVSAGFKKELDVVGVGYRAAKQGKTLTLNVGYSHVVNIDEIPGITIDVPAPNKIIISGPDKQAVGQFAAEVRKVRPPNVFKGKGIRYSDEVVMLRAGKAGAKKK